MTAPSRLLFISGSTRGGSTNTAVLRTAQALAPGGATTVLYEGLADLPAFNPDDDHDPLPSMVTDLRGKIGAADVVMSRSDIGADGLVTNQAVRDGIVEALQTLSQRAGPPAAEG